MFAYSYSKTVILHAGLLETLKTSAENETGNEEEANELFDSALAFVLYHELGHIQLGHVGANLKGYADRINPLPEIQADTFAAKMIMQTGYTLDGADLVFSVLSRLNPAGSVAHPPRGKG